MHKSFKFRLYPNKRQAETLVSTLRCCRRLYNAALEQHRAAWRLRRTKISRYDQQKQIPDIRREFPEYASINTHVLRDPLRRLEQAFKMFFQRIKRGEKPGYPRFKTSNRYDSLLFDSAGAARIKDKRVYLSKIGAVKFKQHRPIEGRIKTATIKREGTKWFVIFSCDNIPEKPLPPSDKAVGIDVGLTHFATLSDGTTVKNPRYLKQSLSKLKTTQQTLSTKKRGTSARHKARARVRSIHRKIRNQRKDFLHKLSRRLVSENGLIAIENLNVKGMLKKKRGYRKLSAAFRRSIGDAGWAQFANYLSHKAEEAGAGRRVVKVDPQGTTRTCSACGRLNGKLPLSQREFVCAECGFRLDRDLNAARNILRVGEQPCAKAQKSVG